MEDLSPPLKRLINRFEDKTNLIFKPNASFYKTVGINRHRFALFTRGRKKPDTDEIKGLMHYFSQFFPITAEDLL